MLHVQILARVELNPKNEDDSTFCSSAMQKNLIGPSHSRRSLGA